ncbi:MAG: hypothetical protein A3F16_02550 [Deltaproteobacteria bacterium RIFCSPHIGHO2_12_FULL_43_9]|nr:MAG: hypothetical protein A3F16_02550 [Deltaproteobacteria bacterium RIFCSPHIGHO2_12_FULL_43_9]
MFKNIYTFINDESGQGTAEYLLILAAAVAIVLIFKEKVVETIRGLAQKVGQGLDTTVDQLLKPGG